MSYKEFKPLKEEWMQDLWLDLSNAYLWNTEANKDILNEDSFPFPIFVATAYESTNNKDFVPIENSRTSQQTQVLCILTSLFTTPYKIFRSSL